MCDARKSTLDGVRKMKKKENFVRSDERRGSGWMPNKCDGKQSFSLASVFFLIIVFFVTHPTSKIYFSLFVIDARCRVIVCRISSFHYSLSHSFIWCSNFVFFGSFFLFSSLIYLSFMFVWVYFFLAGVAILSMRSFAHSNAH